MSPSVPKLEPESNLHHCCNVTLYGLSSQQSLSYLWFNCSWVSLGMTTLSLKSLQCLPAWNEQTFVIETFVIEKEVTLPSHLKSLLINSAFSECLFDPWLASLRHKGGFCSYYLNISILATWSHPLLGIHSCAVNLVAESVQFINLAENIMLCGAGGFARAMFSCITTLNSLTKVLTHTQSWREERIAQERDVWLGAMGNLFCWQQTTLHLSCSFVCLQQSQKRLTTLGFSL